MSCVGSGKGKGARVEMANQSVPILNEMSSKLLFLTLNKFNL